METLLLAALAAALVAVVFALVRETRWRRALQKLLKAILKNWRSREQDPDL